VVAALVDMAGRRNDFRMRTHLIRLAIASGLAAAPAASQVPEPPPSVVLIITDDMGWGDLGHHGARDVRTPNIDRLAREGVRFADFYSNGLNCSPTRAGLITGRYQQRVGIEEPLPNARLAGERGLVATGQSLPQLLRGRGYATALVGKWHLGYLPQHSPHAHGFDYFFGLKSGYHDFYTHRERDGQNDLWENDQRVEVEGYSTDLITERAIRFVEANARRPFFIDVAFNAPHWPYQRPGAPSVARSNGIHLLPGDSATSTRADYVAMVEHVDRGVGEILAAIERLGIARNTIVIFTNDNGGEWLADNGPYFNRKSTVWEGGIRVPAIVRWPARLPAGTVTQQVGITMDLAASIIAAAGIPTPAAAYEGIDLFPILEGRAPLQERTLFWRATNSSRSQRAVRSGPWKLVMDGGHQFVYDLRDDPGERRDLARRRQDVARRLWLALQAWERDVDAGKTPAP
jgi:arylsulfatase A-like enzyme